MTHLPSHYRIRQALLRVAGLRGIPPAGSLRSRVRERLLTCGWPDNAEAGYYSQGGQDRFIDQIVFGGREGGRFIEIGANDGLTLSNSLFFERERAWSGACVEPNPPSFAKLESNRPATRNLPWAVADTCGEADFPVVSDPEESLYASVGGSSDEGRTTVKQVDLPTLFEACGYSSLDLLFIDTEGGELETLGSLRNTPVRPEVICVEENTTPEELDRQMAELGYKLLARVWPDRIYQHQ